MRVFKRIARIFPLAVRTPLLEGVTQVHKYTKICPLGKRGGRAGIRTPDPLGVNEVL